MTKKDKRMRPPEEATRREVESASVLAESLDRMFNTIKVPLGLRIDTVVSLAVTYLVEQSAVEREVADKNFPWLINLLQQIYEAGDAEARQRMAAMLATIPADEPRN